jgi:hypothetical protein
MRLGPAEALLDLLLPLANEQSCTFAASCLPFGMSTTTPSTEAAFENEFVHEVYDSIAAHFSTTRYKASYLPSDLRIEPPP